VTDRVSWAVEGSDWPNREASRFVDAAQLRWHVQVMGTGPVLLLLHGTGAATHSWRDLMPMLAEHHTVVAPDLPGHGFTTGRAAGGLTMVGMARAVAGLVAAMALPPAVVVGHSAGAAIGMRAVLDRLIAPQAIIGLSPALMPFPGLAARLFPALAKLLFVNPFPPVLLARMARGQGEVARFLPRATGSRIDARGIELYARLFATPAGIAGPLTMMAEWDLEGFSAMLPRLAEPTLLLHGERDSAVPAKSAREAAARIPGARIDVVPGGHLMHEEHPRDVADRILSFARETLACSTLTPMA
jgi:magnesium chelatase accessory protein